MVDKFSEYLKGCNSLQELYNKINAYTTESSYTKLSVYSNNIVTFNVYMDFDKFERDFEYKLETAFGSYYIEEDDVCIWWTPNRLAVSFNSVIDDTTLVEDYFNFVKIAEEFYSKSYEISQRLDTFRNNSPIIASISGEISNLLRLSDNLIGKDKLVLTEKTDELYEQIEAIVSDYGIIFSDSLNFNHYEDCLLKVLTALEKDHKILIGFNGVITFVEDSSEVVDNT